MPTYQASDNLFGGWLSYNLFVEQYWPYVIKILAVLVSAGHGWFLATVPADWREDRWNEMQGDGGGNPIAMPDPIGMYQGCMSYWVVLVASIRSSCIMYGAANTLAPLVGLTLALFGWPLPSHIFRERGGFALILLEPFIWIVIGSTCAGYLVGRLLHEGFFKKRIL